MPQVASFRYIFLYGKEVSFDSEIQMLAAFASSVVF